MSKMLFIRGATLKHINGNSYPASNIVMSQDLSVLPIGVVVPDDEFNNVISIFSSGSSLFINEDGTFTSKYYALKNAISDIYTIPLFAWWGSGPDNSTKILQAFSNYNILTSYVSGEYNNAVIVKNNYELYCDVPNQSTVEGTYKDGSLIDGFSRYGSFVGYAWRTTLFIYNESLTLSYGIVIDPASYKGLAVGYSTTYSQLSIPTAVKNMLLDIAEIGDLPTDPYDNGGTSGTGGGTGSFDGTGDNINIPSLPTLSAASTGFITLFNPTIGQLHELSAYMWSNGFDLATFKKLFADPMDCILGLSIVPVAVPNGETSIVSVGNISTGVSMTKAATQYVTVDCGTLNVNEYWGAYLDYDPFTKAEIYLPYIGTHALSVDDIMGKSVHVVYHIDILSGACCAHVKCGGSVLYSFVGQCSCSIPITGNDWTNVVNGALSIAASIGTMVATGGATAPMAATTIASTAVNSMKPNVEKSGSMGGMGGMLGVQTPYLILTRPRQALPARQNKFTGYPSFITESLGDLSGYTEIEEIHLENISATESELSEIENLLKSGVIF